MNNEIIEKEITVSDWAEDYLRENSVETKPRLPKFNITLGKGEIAKTETITFITEGTKIENQYGKSILFTVNYKGVDMVWFIKAKSFSLLSEIAKNKPVAGKAADVTRAGTTQADTRWAIKFK
jgi:hypothetical protein